MIQKTLSFCRGKGNLNHNNRKFLTDNVDKNRVKDNIIYIQNDLKKMYDDIFKNSVDEYNSKQTRSDRKIEDYYEKISRAKKEKLFHEVVVQLGEKNMSDFDKSLCKKTLDSYMKSFQDRNPNLKVVNAVMHLDESTPHLHIDFIPVATGYKKGMRKRNSISKALNGKLDVWYERERLQIEKIANKFNIDIVLKNEPKRQRLSVKEYKLNSDRVEELKNTVSKLENDKRDKEIELDGLINRLNDLKTLKEDLIDPFLKPKEFTPIDKFIYPNDMSLIITNKHDLNRLENNTFSLTNSNLELLKLLDCSKDENIKLKKENNNLKNIISENKEFKIKFLDISKELYQEKLKNRDLKKYIENLEIINKKYLNLLKKYNINPNQKIEIKTPNFNNDLTL